MAIRSDVKGSHGSRQESGTSKTLPAPSSNPRDSTQTILIPWRDDCESGRGRPKQFPKRSKERYFGTEESLKKEEDDICPSRNDISGLIPEYAKQRPSTKPWPASGKRKISPQSNGLFIIKTLKKLAGSPILWYLWCLFAQIGGSHGNQDIGYNQPIKHGGTAILYHLPGPPEYHHEYLVYFKIAPPGLEQLNCSVVSQEEQICSFFKGNLSRKCAEIGVYLDGDAFKLSNISETFEYCAHVKQPPSPQVPDGLEIINGLVLVIPGDDENTRPPTTPTTQHNSNPSNIWKILFILHVCMDCLTLVASVCFVLYKKKARLPCLDSEQNVSGDSTHSGSDRSLGQRKSLDRNTVTSHLEQDREERACLQVLQERS